MPQKTKKDKKAPIPTEFPPRPTLHKINDVLATLFYVSWLIIGAFFLLIIFAQIKQGALKSIVSTPARPSPQVQTPTETDLPGVGRVNIACVQQSLTQEAIQMLTVDGNASNLTADEKAKLDPCIVK